MKEKSPGDGGRSCSPPEEPHRCWRPDWSQRGDRGPQRVPAGPDRSQRGGPRWDPVLQAPGPVEEFQVGKHAKIHNIELYRLN